MLKHVSALPSFSWLSKPFLMPQGFFLLHLPCQLWGHGDGGQDNRKEPSSWWCPERRNRCFSSIAPPTPQHTQTSSDNRHDKDCYVTTTSQQPSLDRPVPAHGAGPPEPLSKHNPCPLSGGPPNWHLNKGRVQCQLGRARCSSLPSTSFRGPAPKLHC